jgi:hypothetical protein
LLCLPMTKTLMLGTALGHLVGLGNLQCRRNSIGRDPQYDKIDALFRP